jgi:hypothetical protein
MAICWLKDARHGLVINLIVHNDLLLIAGGMARRDKAWSDHDRQQPGAPVAGPEAGGRVRVRGR